MVYLGSYPGGYLKDRVSLRLRSYGHAEAVEVLLSEGEKGVSGINVDVVPKDGRTAIMQACEFGHADCAKLLKKHGADHEFRRSHRGDTAHDLAIRAGSSAVRRVFEPTASDKDVAKMPLDGPGECVSVVHRCRK